MTRRRRRRARRAQRRGWTTLALFAASFVLVLGVLHFRNRPQDLPWTALDLGVSWRTPWRGEISVGAQNLWSAPLDAAPRDVDPSQARTPYIQYRQDL